MITKAARKELFVFAQNTRKQRVEAGARIVISDGKKIVAEGISDERGVWRYRGDSMRERRLYVFATTAQGSGASTLDLSSLRTSQGLSPRGAVWTDRVLYAPGEVIHAKAALRDVTAGNYVVPPQEVYRFDCIDPSGRMIQSREIKSDEFGTLIADFPLPEDAKVGNYTVRVRRARDSRLRAS